MTADADHFNPSVIFENPLYMPDAKAAEEAERYLQECIQSKDSAGGIIECVVQNMKPGIGEPVFEKLDANLGKALFSIGAVKGVEIGDGFAAAKSTGHKNNDEYTLSADGDVIKLTNHSGGVLGGISDGSDLDHPCRHKAYPFHRLPPGYCDQRWTFHHYQRQRAP